MPAWLLDPSLRALAYEHHAGRVASALAGAAALGGLREYYDPLTGRSMGACGFGWSVLLADLVGVER